MFDEQEDMSEWLPANTEGLSDKQRFILASISKFQSVKGYSPSLREIGEMVGLSAVASVKYQLDQIREKGFLNKNEGKQRAMDVVRTSTTGVVNLGNAKQVPWVGRIAAGGPITAEQNVEDVFTISASRQERRPIHSQDQG
jgi:repressor LexA